MITAVDVGATKTLIAQFKDRREPVNEMRFETPGGTEVFLHELTTHLGQLPSIGTLSIGVPGMVTEQGLILRCGNLPWEHFPLGHILKQTYRCEVYIENDAKMAALAEIHALSPMPSLGMYLTISTGIGSGIVIDGKLMRHFRDSEAGHMMLQTSEGLQKWQDVASGRTIKAHFNKLARELSSPKEWQWVAKQLAIGLNALIPAIQPEVIVFGGGVGQFFDKFGPYLIKQLQKDLPPYIALPRFAKAKHPEEAVIYGCYYYATHPKH